MSNSPGWYGPQPTGEALEKANRLAEHWKDGPRLIQRGRHSVISIRPPYYYHPFKSVLQRHGFRWDGETWSRRTTPGKELTALRWARDLYYVAFGFELPPIQEVAGPLAGQVPREFP